MGDSKARIQSQPLIRRLVRLKPEMQFLKSGSIVPSPPKSGEKVADRPDEGAFEPGSVREMPPHPALSPKSFAASWLCTTNVQSCKRFGGEGTKLWHATKNPQLQKAQAKIDAQFSSIAIQASTVHSTPGYALRLLVMGICAFFIAPIHVAAQMTPPNGDRPQVDFAGLDIQAIAGWDGTVDQSVPIPLSFLISNSSDDVIEGQLILTDPLNGKELVLGEIFIGPNSVKRFSSIQALTDWYQCVATLSHEDRILWRRELAITTGMDFSEDLNYLLFVDDGNRMLQWPVDESTADNSSSRFIPKPGHGRPVQPLAVKSWQVPQHPGPLTVAQAMVFSETANPDMLNEAQWAAVAKWICLGGTVFVSEKSTELIDRLKKAAPLIAQPAVSLGQLAVHRCGGGSVRAYSGPLFSADDTTAPRLIAEAAARLSRYNLMTMLDETNLNRWESQNTDKTRILVVAVFGIYTLLSGFGTLLLFRQNRRRIAAYTGSVVLAACVASMVLGGVLRSSLGDLRWVTVTEAGPGGLVQLARIEVESAGGRNTLLAVRGRHSDLQLVESDANNRGYYYSYYSPAESSRTGYEPFSWQGNLLPDEPDTCQIKVPITPWGYREAYASAFDSTVRDLEFKLNYEPPDIHAESLAMQLTQPGFPPGQFTLTVTNHLPFDLTDCRLVIGRTGVNQVASTQTQTYDPRTGSFIMQTGAGAGDLLHIGTWAPFQDLPASTAVTHVEVAWATEGLDSRWLYSSNLSPRIAYDGATSFWITGKIARSPILSIDEQRSDFEFSGEMHLFVQEILPEDIPEEWMKLQQLVLDQQRTQVAPVNSP